MVAVIEEFSFLGFLCQGSEKIGIDFSEASGFEGFCKDANEANRKWCAFLLRHYPQLNVKYSVTNLSIAKQKPPIKV